MYWTRNEIAKRNKNGSRALNCSENAKSGITDLTTARNNNSVGAYIKADRNLLLIWEMRIISGNESGLTR